MVAPARPPLRRVSRREPCPICNHHKGCEIRPDGAVNCIRVESPYESHRLGGHWHRLPVRAASAERVTWRADDFSFTRDTPATPTPEIANADTLHAVYSALLAACSLSPADRAHLMGPKRQVAALDLGEYGTLPSPRQQAPIVAGLMRRFGASVLRTVPGFIQDQDVAGGLRLSPAGLLIPVRDAEARIQGFQVRCSDGAYRWLSSTAGGGPGSGAPAHVARPRGEIRDPRVYITEGPLKANIAAARLGAVVVAMAGIGTWQSILPILEVLQAGGQGAVAAMLALDADDPAKRAGATVRAVETVRQETAVALYRMGYAVRIARWDHAAGKGIDDLLLAGGTFTVEIFRPRPGPDAPDPGTPEDDEHAAGLDDGPLTDTKKLRILSNTLLNKSLKPTDKVTLCNIYLLSGAWPSAAPQRQEEDLAPAAGEGWRRKPIATIAARVNAGRNTVSRSIHYLEDRGLAIVDVRTEMHPPLPFRARGDTAQTEAPRPVPRPVAYFRPARPLGFDEEVPEAEHRIVDRKRRCPGCGSERVVTHTVRCTRCGEISSAQAAEKAAADYERARYAADRTARGQETDEATCDGCTESVQHPESGERCTGAAPPRPDETPAPHAAMPRDGCTESASPRAVPPEFIPVPPGADPLEVWDAERRRRWWDPIGAKIDEGKARARAEPPPAQVAAS